MHTYTLFLLALEKKNYFILFLFLKEKKEYHRIHFDVLLF